MDKDIYYCALGRIFGFKPRIARAFLETLGSAEEAFRLDSGELEELLGTFSQERRLISNESLGKAAEDLEEMSKLGIRFINIDSPEYPPLLKECEDAPIGLYVRGELPAPGRDTIAVVGTRDISMYGTEWCTRIVKALGTCKEKPAIISGLALGTDITAQITAVEYGLPTVGVMATGPETVYPARHRGFADRICNMAECALVTDYPPGTAPLPIHFLRRNRIIAGMARATILIESKIKGGGRMTAKYAFDYNRNVYALPGRVDDIRSQGCNYLIRSNLAEAIETVENLIGSLALSKEKNASGRAAGISGSYSGSLDPDRIGQMSKILLTIKTRRGITADEIVGKTGIPFTRVTELLGILESDSFITSDIIGRYMINVKKM